MGASGYEQSDKELRIDCCSWSGLRRLANIRDYDTVVLDLLDLANEDARKAIDWPSFHRALSFRNAVDILKNGGEIIVVGDPRFQVPAALPPGGQQSDPSADRPFLSWSGIMFVWDPEPGDTATFIRPDNHSLFENYVSYLRKWDYSMERCSMNPHFKKHKGAEISLTTEVISENRYRHALVFRLWFMLDEVVCGGTMTFLPKISLSSEETRQLVLADLCQVQVSIPEPSWITEYTVPGQPEIDKGIREIEAELQAANDKLQNALERRTEARQCLRLLYEGQFALESVVRGVLRGLRADVEEPTELNKEDGWIVVDVGENTYEGVLEVKSTLSDQFGENGRKQLLDWIDRGRTVRHKEYKGIFIGNSAIGKHPKERPLAFSDSWTKAAELSKICALKTEDLYVIHLLHAKGIVDIHAFWDDLFSTNGVFDADRYRELLSRDES